jgi:hypothetical protein
MSPSTCVQQLGVMVEFLKKRVLQILRTLMQTKVQLKIRLDKVMAS